MTSVQAYVKDICLMLPISDRYATARPRGVPRATMPALMAVPKKRTSRTRRDKRRATHRAGKPRLNECPRCHSPRLPHRVCPECGTYAGREVIAHEVGEADQSASQEE